MATSKLQELFLNITVLLLLGAFPVHKIFGYVKKIRMGSDCLFLNEVKSELKRYGDGQTHDLPNIKFLHDIRIFYISYEKTNFLKIKCSKVNKFC